MKLLCSIFITVLLLTQVTFGVVQCYVAPVAQGNGDGLSMANAANYRSLTFWNGIRSSLAVDDVTVHFKAGNYTGRMACQEVAGIQEGEYACLDLTYIGDDGHLLFLDGYEGGVGHAYFETTSDVNSLLNLYGAVNVVVHKFVFRGYHCKDQALKIVREAHDIEVDECNFEELTQAVYGGIVINTDAYNMYIHDCYFARVGAAGDAHMIYMNKRCHDIDIYDNHFEDCSTKYLKIRNRVDDVTISGNTFVATGEYENEVDDDEVSVIFFRADSWGGRNEIFGDGYTIYGNTFELDSSSQIRYPIRWSYKGVEREGLNQIPSSLEDEDLQYGGPDSKMSFLISAGVLGDVNISGNIYNLGHPEYPRITYQYWTLDENNEPAMAVTRDVSIGFYQTRFSYNWESESDLNYWAVSEVPPYSDIYTTPNIPIQGARSVRLKDLSSSHIAKIEKSVGTSITYGYYRTWLRVNSHTTHVYPVYTTSPSAIYWIRGNGDHTWGNTVTTFSGSWTTATWYFIEIVFDFDTDTYTVWINSDKVADNISIPTSNTSMSGNLVISPAGTSAQGDIQIDYNLLGFYE